MTRCGFELGLAALAMAIGLVSAAAWPARHDGRAVVAPAHAYGVVQATPTPASDQATPLARRIVPDAPLATWSGVLVVPGTASAASAPAHFRVAASGAVSVADAWREQRPLADGPERFIVVRTELAEPRGEAAELLELLLAPATSAGALRRAPGIDGPFEVLREGR